MATTILPPTHLLEDAATLARGSILARLDPALDFQPFFRLDLGGAVPVARHASWDYCDMAGRFVDALILTAPMTGAAAPTAAEDGLRRFLLGRANPADGLFYDAEAPWSRYAADMFCQGRVLLGLVSWFLLSGDAAVEDAIEGLVAGLSRLAVWEGDACSYPTDVRVEGRWEEGGLWQGRAPGYAAQQTVGLARYAQATGSPAALRLAGGLARQFSRSGVVANDGTFRGHTHSQGILPSTLGVLRSALVAGDADLAAWSRRVYEHARRHTSAAGWIPDGLGLDPAATPYAGTCETCALADLIELAIVLTEAGLGDYWDDVERFARNQLLAQQFTDLADLVPAADPAPDGPPVAPILRGAFDSAARPNSLLGDPHGVVEGCCTPAGARACALVWDRIVTEDADGIAVNLAFGRDAPWARLSSFEPDRGELRLEIRQARRFSLRLPAWAERDRTRLTVDGEERPPRWAGRSLALGAMRPGQTVVVTYPQRLAELTETLAGETYVTHWQGGTVTRIEPTGGRYPLYARRASAATGPPPSERDLPVRPVVVSW